MSEEIAKIQKALIEGYTVTPMTQNDVDESTQLHVESSSELNPLWKHCPSKKEDLLVDFKARMSYFAKDNNSYVLRDAKTNELVSVLVSIDAKAYLESTATLPRESDLLKLQQNYDEQLEKQYITPESVTERGNVLIQYYISIKQDLAQGGLASKFFFYCMEEFRRIGYKHIYSRTTSHISTNKYVKLGAKVLEEVKFPTNEGDKTYIWWIHLELQNYPPIKLLLQTLQEKPSSSPNQNAAHPAPQVGEETKNNVVDFRQELAANAARLSTAGKGILAADESEGTLGKQFVAIGVENVTENRRAYRELLFTTPGLEEYISGVILFSETAHQSTTDNVQFIDLLTKRGILSGIKVDKGLGVLPGTQDENTTKGLDSLDAMTKEYYALGCRFAKWRAVLKIGDGCPTNLSIQENAWGLARYAAICQQNGLVPIVEPEILSDGDHSIQVCQQVTERVLAAVVKALNDNNIFLEGCLLKPNMVTPGSKNPDRHKISPTEIGIRTATALSRTIPPSMVGVFFLSGGQSEEEASLNLNAINKITGVRQPWFLSFSYGRALQNTAVQTWSGKPENVKHAQQELLQRAKANSEAQLGKYQGSSDSSGSESLFVENYQY